jgi:tetratricopeptide (TPR) repeat protein
VPSPSQELEEIQRQLAAIDETPPSEVLPFLDDLLRRAKAVPPDVALPLRLDVLIDIGMQFYLDGRDQVRPIEPLALAAALAEQFGDRFRLRRALSIQGIALANFGHCFQALSVLRKALKIAEDAGEHLGVAAAWGNIALAFNEGMLCTEASMAARLSMAACENLAEPNRSAMLSRCYHALAIAGLHLQDYPAAIAATGEALRLYGAPSDRVGEQIVALIGVTRVQLLLRVGRLKEAEEHADTAMLLAGRSGASRARIEATAVYGLVEVYAGKTAAGLARIAAARREARHGLIALRLDTLRAAIQAHEKIGRPDEALRLYRELMDLIRELRLRAITEAHTVSAHAGDPGARADRALHASLDRLARRTGELLSARPPSHAARAVAVPH